MGFIKNLVKRFKSPGANDEVLPAEKGDESADDEKKGDDSSSQDSIRKSAIHRKLKDIGYRTEEISIKNWPKKE